MLMRGRTEIKQKNALNDALDYYDPDNHPEGGNIGYFGNASKVCRQSYYT